MSRRAGLDLSTMLWRGRRLEPEALKSGHARGPTPLGASPSFSYPGGGGICRQPGRGSPTSGSKCGFRRASCFRYIFYREKRAIPHRIWAPGRIFWAPHGGSQKRPRRASLNWFFNFCQIRVVDVFWVASATPKDPHKSAHHEHQRAGSRVSDAAESLENTEIAVNTVVFVLLRTFPF